MKILLYCPTYEVSKGKLAAHQATLDSIDALIIPDGVDMDVSIDPYNPLPVTGIAKQDHENTLIKYRRARQRVLAQHYDVVLFIEHDMIVPEDALVKMLNTDADVVYGLYLFRHVSPVLNCLRDVKARWVDMSVTFFDELREKGYKQGWLECSGSGFGCTLIHRHVLERIDFRRAESGHPVPDMPFATDCLRAGYKQICRFDVQCGHIKTDGSVIWPSKTGGDIMANVKIYVYRSFNANISGKTEHFEEGEKAEMPEQYAGEFMRAGYIGVIEDKPAVKVVSKPKQKATKTVKGHARDDKGRFVEKEAD